MDKLRELLRGWKTILLLQVLAVLKVVTDNATSTGVDVDTIRTVVGIEAIATLKAGFDNAASKVSAALGAKLG